MGSRTIPVPPFSIIVLGATGDLAKRKLYTALWQRIIAGQAPDSCRLIGASRTAQDADAYRAMLRACLPPADSADATARQDRWLATAEYFTVGNDAAADANNWRALQRLLQNAPAPHIFYFAVAPQVVGSLCQHLQNFNLLSEDSRIVLEKPIGWDLASARDLNVTAQATLPERCIYRIDHYLGKETVQNLMALRFANALLEPLWNARMIDHIQITVAEEIGVEARGGYYERVGAVRDMLQNHLLQLLCLTAMEPPQNYDADSIRDEKLKVLHSLQPVRDAEESVVLGQYQSGNGCASYRADIANGGVDTETASGSAHAETFVAVRCAINNWRWAGTPFYLRTGKRLSARRSEIVVQFKSPPHSIFPSSPQLAGNQLVIGLQPQEGITLHINIKEPGVGGFRMCDAPLDMSFADSLAQPLPDAYERLLMDVVRGDQTLFMRNDEVEAAWQWVEPILQYAAQTTPLPYACGSSGPEEALRLMHADGRRWRAIQ